MSATKEDLSDLEEKFNKVTKLLENSKQDSPNTPFASKYAARTILYEMETKLKSIRIEENDLTLMGMLGTVYLYLGTISLDVEEFPNSETNLEKCHEIIKNNIECRETVMVALNLFNQLGILWAEKEPEKSKFYLEKSEKLYFDFTQSNGIPLDIHELYNTDQSNPVLAQENLEKVHTLTLYYLAQIYGTLKDTIKSALYCHNTLQRQLNSQDYDSIDWSLNAATLSQFFLEKNAFNQARHHLAASSFILKKYENELKGDDDEIVKAKIENFKHRSADICRCWAKYGIHLLVQSKERLLNDEPQNISSDLQEMHLNDLKFNLDLTDIEKQVSDEFVLTIEDAKLVFFNIKKWLEEAAIYYTIDVLASDYIEIVQDQSQMYLNLLFFDDDVSNQAKLHKRRIDLLENVLSKINPKFYLQYCRQLWYELAQTYTDILNIKCDKLREMRERPSAHMLTKINILTEKSIENFRCFIQSFEKQKLDGDSVKPYLLAHFHIAALTSKFITLDKKKQLEHVETSLEEYKKVVDYCESNEAKKVIPLEFNICKEMVSLLPIKIVKLRQEIF